MTADSFIETLALEGLSGHDAFYHGLSRLRSAYGEKQINSVEAKKVRTNLAQRYGVSLSEAETTWKNLAKDSMVVPNESASQDAQLAYLSWVLSLEIEGFKVYKSGDSSKNQYYMQINVDGESREVVLGEIEGLTQRTKFTNSVVDQVGIWPAEVDKNAWRVIQEIIMRVIEQVTLDEISEDNQLKVWIVSYLRENPANNMAEDFFHHAAVGIPVSIDGDIYINTVSFHRYLVTVFRKNMSPTSLGKMLNKYGFKKRRFQKGGLDMFYRFVPPEYILDDDAGILQPGPKNSQTELRGMKYWDDEALE